MSTTQQTNRATAIVGDVAQWTEDRTSASKAVREFGRKIFPSHWSFMLGEVALYSFVILVLTGTFLTFWFKPAMAEVIYNGPWTPLRGVTISEAYQSTLEISFEVRGGLFIRQMHHWAALLFMAGLSIHALRVFFTGAFRKPRELNWVIGIVLSMVGLGAGFTGYSLPDDLLSGNGLRIIDGLLKSIPLVGTYISFFLFGGEFPGIDIVSRLYSLHIMILPAVLIALIGVHMMFLVIHKHTHWAWPGAHREERRGRAGSAVVRGEGRRVLLHDLRGHSIHIGALHDEPDLELRPVRPLPRLRRHPAGLVRRMGRRHPPHHAGMDGVLHLRLPHQPEHQYRDHHHDGLLGHRSDMAVDRIVAAEG